MRLTNKIACITGGGGEIATGIALAFAREGAAILVSELDAAKARSTVSAVEAAGGRAAACIGSVADEAHAAAAVAQAVEAFGGLDILVHAAACVTPDGTAETLPVAEWEQALAVNLTGAFLFAKYAVPEMRRRGGGAIVNIASQLGHLGVGGRSPYCVTKAALINLSRVMAIDHAADNIRVNSLSPGAVDTERSSRRYGGREAARRVHGPKHLLNRTATVVEVAAAALYLASDDASFVTGTDLLVDGGYTAFKGTVAD